MKQQRTKTREEWRELFDYNPDGTLTKKSTGYVYGGSKGYRFVAVWENGKTQTYLQHRVVWEWHNSTIPEGMMLDHINMNPADNRIENLRLATTWENTVYAVHAQHKAGGYQGVTKVPGGYEARIGHLGETLCLGRYRTARDAHLVYIGASRALRGNRGFPSDEILEGLGIESGYDLV